MDAWMTLVLLSITLSFVIRIVLSGLRKKKSSSKLPPGPPSVPIISTILWLRRSKSDINAIFRELQAKYGSILTLRIASRTVILVADHGVAHRALVQGGAAFADRPPMLEFKAEIIGRHLINQSPYGPMWRLLRGNLTSKLLHPSRVKLFAEGRRWALRTLVDELKCQAEGVDGAVVAAGSCFGDAIFKLMLLMCFGKKVDEEERKEIKAMLRSLELGMKSGSIFAFCPKITKLLFRRKWSDLLGIRRKNLEIFIPLIKERERRREKEHDSLYPYVDSLLELQVDSEEEGGGGRRLTDDEVVSLCSELILVGADTTTTALEWIMAELVVHQEVQKKLLEEIESVVGKSEEMEEEKLLRMPYLNAVVLEGLRRHPLSHFGAPHAVTKDVEIDSYVIPKDAMVLFMLAEMGWDEKVWEVPMEFEPERFFGSWGGGVDVTGSREIKMMPFGAGRRICPGLGLAMLHLQYFVANLVREFEWKVVDGEEVDLSEKSDITLSMKNPLRARIAARRTSTI